MDDSINKLSEIRSKYNCFDESEEPYYRALSEAIDVLSRHADGDTISRQAVIDEIREWKTRLPVEGLVDHIIVLPSTQPEIIRCKDCRWGKEVCGNIECFADTNVPPEYHGYEWFCPNGERRTDE